MRHIIALHYIANILCLFASRKRAKPQNICVHISHIVCPWSVALNQALTGDFLGLLSI